MVATSRLDARMLDTRKCFDCISDKLKREGNRTHIAVENRIGLDTWIMNTVLLRILDRTHTIGATFKSTSSSVGPKNMYQMLEAAVGDNARIIQSQAERR